MAIWNRTRDLIDRLPTPVWALVILFGSIVPLMATGLVLGVVISSL